MSDSLRTLLRRHPALRTALAPALAARHWYSRRKRAEHDVYHQRFIELLAEDPVLRVAQFEGEFAVGASSDLFRRLILHDSYENELVELAKSHLDRNRDAIDIGANIGFFSVLLAKQMAPQGRRVLAVEPTPNALARLHANLARNGVADSVTVFEGVAADKPGTISMNVVVGKEEYSSIQNAKHPRITGEEGKQYRYETRDVEATTIDQLVESHGIDPGFMKIDVEGAEHIVLAGAQQTLARNRPVILAELNDRVLRENGSSAAEVIAMVAQHDYEIVDPLDPTRPIASQEYGDMLCIPR